MWKDALERAQRLMTGRANDVADATRLIDDYRLLAHDLARASRLMPESRAREFLEMAYAQAHAALHKPVTHPGYALWSLFRDQIPEAIRWLRPHIIWVTLLFVASIFVGGLAGQPRIRTSSGCSRRRASSPPSSAASSGPTAC